MSISLQPSKHILLREMLQLLIPTINRMPMLAHMPRLGFPGRGDALRISLPRVTPATAPSSGERAKNAGQARGNFHARPWPQFPQPVMKIAIPAYRPIGPLAGYCPATPFRLRVPSHPMAGTASGLSHLPLNKFQRMPPGWFGGNQEVGRPSGKRKTYSEVLCSREHSRKFNR